MNEQNIEGSSSVPEPEVEGFLKGFFWNRAGDAFDREYEERKEAWGVSDLDGLVVWVSVFGFGFFWFFLGWGLLVVFGLMGSWGAGWLAGVWAWVYGGFVTYGWVVWCERYEYERALWREGRRLERRERVEAGVSMLFDALRRSTGEEQVEDEAGCPECGSGELIVHSRDEVECGLCGFVFRPEEGGS